jgi:hypothetical protein
MLNRNSNRRSHSPHGYSHSANAGKHDRKTVLVHEETRRTVTAVVLAAAFLLSARAAPAQEQGDPDRLDSAPGSPPVLPHMPESQRQSIDRVVVIAGRGSAEKEVDGSYDKATPGFVGGMASGSDMATISKEIGGVPVNIPIPGMQLPAAIFGGLTGITQQEIQDFRDALTEELTESDSPPLRSDGLANDAFWVVRRLGSYQPTLINPGKDIPADADVVLYTDFDALSIDVDRNDAVITTSILARLKNAATGEDIYRTVISYRDRDSLGNWTRDDNALWRSYTNFARYYLGRAAAADVLGRLDVTGELLPSESADARFHRKIPMRLVSDVAAPTLSWRHAVDDEHPYGSFASAIDKSTTRYDLEIFDERQLVYDAQGIEDPSHRLEWELEPCRVYRWSVRPVYTVDGQTRLGDWMRIPPGDGEASSAQSAAGLPAIVKGLDGRSASTAPAYTQDFAELEIACRR